MTTIWKLLFLVLALACFLISTLPMTAPYHVRLVALGLAFMTASMLPLP